MKVLKEGKPVEKVAWKQVVKCTGEGNSGGGCDALLQVVRSDLRFYDGNSGYFQRPNAVVMRCPCCGATTDLNKSQWPKNPHELYPFTKKWKREGIDDEQTEQWSEYIKRR